jgi:hypothetical protein
MYWKSGGRNIPANGRRKGCWLHPFKFNELFTKKRGLAKRKKKQKKKTVLKYGKLKEFPTFQHDKQTTSSFNYYL